MLSSINVCNFLTSLQSPLFAGYCQVIKWKSRKDHIFDVDDWLAIHQLANGLNNIEMPWKLTFLCFKLSRTFMTCVHWTFARGKTVNCFDHPKANDSPALYILTHFCHLESIFDSQKAASKVDLIMSRGEIYVSFFERDIISFHVEIVAPRIPPSSDRRSPPLGRLS